MLENSWQEDDSFRELEALAALVTELPDPDDSNGLEDPKAFSRISRT